MVVLSKLNSKLKSKLICLRKQARNANNTVIRVLEDTASGVTNWSRE